MIGDTELDFRICETDAEGNLTRVIARAASFNVAIAAYEAAIVNDQWSGISMLMRARQIKHRPPQPVTDITPGG